MKFILSEVTYGLRRDKKSMTALVILSMIGMYCVNVASHLLVQSKDQFDKYKEVYEDVQYYTILDNFMGENAGVLEDAKNADKMRSFLDLLQNSEHFNYLMMYEQPVYVEGYRGKENNVYGYERSADLASKTKEVPDKHGNLRNSTNVKAFWFGNNVIDHFNLKFSSGKEFTDGDFQLNPFDSISVILGSEYSDTYHVGDTIYVNYVFSDGEAKVIGFLEEGTNVYYRGKLLNLDNYLIMPIFQNDEHEGKEIYNFGINHVYTLRNSGVIATRLSVEDVQEIILDYSKKAGLDGGYYVTEYDSHSKQNFDAGMEMVSFLLMAIAVLAVVAVVFLTGFCIMNKVNHDKKYHAILMLNGCQRVQVCCLLILESFFVFVLSFLLAGLTYVLTIGSASLDLQSACHVLAIQSVLFILYPGILSIGFFMKADLTHYLNEEIE